MAKGLASASSYKAVRSVVIIALIPKLGILKVAKNGAKIQKDNLLNWQKDNI